MAFECTAHHSGMFGGFVVSATLFYEENKMQFQEFLRKDCILANLHALSAEEAISQMMAQFVHTGAIAEAHREAAFAGLMKRERLGSTAIGKHRLIPHTKTTAVGKLTAGLGVARSGFKAQAADGKRVHLVFVLLAPIDAPGEHLRCLEHLARQTRNDALIDELLGAVTPRELWEVLLEDDERRYDLPAALSATH